MDVPVEPSPPRFQDRLRRLRNKRYDELAHIVLGGPLGTFLTAFVAEIPWVTPNRLTLVCFLARLAAAWLILLQTFTADVAVAVLLPLAVVIDIMDGSLARYRRIQSNYGAYLDKVSDTIAIMVFTSALAYRLWLDTGDIRLVFVGFFIGITLLFRRYLYWLRNYLDLHARGKPPAKTNPGLAHLGFVQRVRYYAASSWRVILFSESDFYVAVSLALVLDVLAPITWVVGAGVTPWVLIVLVHRTREVSRLERTAID